MIWIKLEELIDPKVYSSIPIEHSLNLQTLWYKTSLLRKASAIPFTIRTPNDPARGYRTEEMHEELYKKINGKRLANFQNMITPPRESLHLIGAACDVFDGNQILQMWIRSHEDFCKKIGVWFEDFKYTRNWVHISIYPPVSGNLYFVPY